MSTGKLHLLFIRHGETQDNIDRKLQGQRDTSLTEKGKEQSIVLAEKLKDQHIDAFYHSPLLRIRQTIEPILANHPGIQVIADDDLKGQALGELEGGSYDSIDMGNPRSADGGPGVELFDDFVRRLKVVFGRIIGQQAPLTGSDDRVVAIATHGVGITSLFKALENSPDCDGFNSELATRGPEAYEVRWTDSDDVARLIAEKPRELPIIGGRLNWSTIQGKPFIIETWGKREKML